MYLNYRISSAQFAAGAILICMAAILVSCGGSAATSEVAPRTPTSAVRPGSAGGNQPSNGSQDLLFPVKASDRDRVVVAVVQRYDGVDPTYVHVAQEKAGASLLYTIQAEQLVYGADLTTGQVLTIRVDGLAANAFLTDGGGGWDSTTDPPLEVGARYLMILGYQEASRLYANDAPERMLIRDDGTVHFVDTEIPSVGGIAAMDGMSLTDAIQFILTNKEVLGPTPSPSPVEPQPPTTATPNPTAGGLE